MSFKFKFINQWSLYFRVEKALAVGKYAQDFAECEPVYGSEALSVAQHDSAHIREKAVIDRSPSIDNQKHDNEATDRRLASLEEEIYLGGYEDGCFEDLQAVWQPHPHKVGR